MAKMGGGYESGPDDSMANMGNTRAAQMTTLPGLRLPEWLRWLHGQYGDYKSGPNGYLDMMGLPEWHRWQHGQDGNYSSGPDGNMAKMGTTRVAQMATWPGWGLTELVI